jgi:hypothetical protein
MSKLIIPFWLAGLALLAGCAITPDGPSVMVLPGTGKSYEQFQGDDYICRQIALSQIGGVTPQQAAAQSGLATAAVGTAIGAATGAAIGGGQGAAVGSGVGLAAGSAAGAGAAASAGYNSQQRYDYAYIQCMYAKGHRVPVWGRFADQGGAMQLPPQQQNSGGIHPPSPDQPPPR